MSVDLSNYVEVHERIEKFYEKYPEGSLLGNYELVEFAGEAMVIYTARAYRNPDDPRPACGTASEPFPGQTPYTKQSEVMNAETSAWGRALAALGFEVKRGIASANEVRNRQSSGSSNGKPPQPSAKQLDFMAQLLKDAGAENAPDILAYAKENLEGGRGGRFSKAIDALKSPAAKDTALERLQAETAEWQGTLTDIPFAEEEPA